MCLVDLIMPILLRKKSGSERSTVKNGVLEGRKKSCKYLVGKKNSKKKVQSQE